MPSLDRAAFRDWAEQALSSPDQATRTAATAAMTRYLVAMADEMRERPRGDLMSALIRATDEDGGRLSPDELIGMAWLLLVTGFETTVQLISGGVLALLRHPDQLAALRADPSLADGAVEEVLRYEGPVETTTYRFTTGPVEIAGTPIPGGGELVLVSLAGAGRDPARFPTRTASTSTGPRAGTSPSATASTTVWEPRWPACRPVRPSPRSWRAVRTSPWTPTPVTSPGAPGS